MRRAGCIGMIAAAALVAPASASGQAPPSAQAQASARIYVYAQRLTHAGAGLPISCGGAVVAQLRRGTFFAINVTPGRYTLAIENGLPAFISVGAGEESFVRLDWNIGIDRPAIPVLGSVPAAQARKGMKYLSYVKANRVLSSLVPKSDPTETPPLRLKTRDEP
jgi:hypothetical protein